MSNICEELVVPIVVKKVIHETHLSKVVKNNQKYHNVMILNCDDIVYVSNKKKKNSYVRTKPILRYYNEHVCWPEHPLNIEGKILGAIAIIISSDLKILLVRNRKLWGLPKGARNYTDFSKFKTLTDEHYRKFGKIMIHDKAKFTFEKTETSEENVIREIREETGIITNNSLLVKVDGNYAANSYCSYDGYCYRYPKSSSDYADDLASNGTDHENDELQWLDIDKIKDMLSTHKTVYHKIFNHITYGFLNHFIKNESVSGLNE